VHGVRFLAVGADVDAAAYRIKTDEGTFFLKLRRTALGDILSLARFLADESRAQLGTSSRAQRQLLDAPW
jgi:hypothetical protein